MDNTRNNAIIIDVKNDTYLQLQNNPNNHELKQNYRALKNRLRHAIVIAKKEYMNKLIEQCPNSSEKLWNAMNNLCPKPEYHNKIEKIEINNEPITEKQEIANIFNEYYSSLGQKYADHINKPENFSENLFNLENSIYLNPVSNNEIMNIMNDLKSKKSPGWDEIRSETVKQLSDKLAVPLTYIINKCLSVGTFPDCLKLGIIKPLHKNGSKEKIENYRPISLLSVFSKIFEKVIKKRVSGFLDRFGILSDNQFGFREGRSTEEAILKLTGEIYSALDNKVPIISIFIDLSKAFDTVCHERLLEKIYSYGIRGNAFKLMQSYLSNRRQIVNIDGIKSNSKRVTHGVPQGTVLGPLLFCIYVNSLMTTTAEGKIIAFADDMAILYKGNTWIELKTRTEREFIKICDWFKHNELTLNNDKTNYMSFTPYQNHLPHLGPLMIDEDTVITETKQTKYLGIVIDRHLKWDFQIKNTTQKLRGLLSKFRYLVDFLSVRNLKTLYYALVQSLLSYGILGWGGVAENTLHSLVVMQKWILRVIFKKNIRYSSEMLFTENNLLDIRQIFCERMLIYIYKNKIPIQPIEHTYNTRTRTNHINVPLREKTIGQRSVKFLAPKIYNLLPNDLKTLQSFKKFKHRVKLWILATGRSKFKDIIDLKFLQ